MNVAAVKKARKRLTLGTQLESAPNGRAARLRPGRNSTALPRPLQRERAPGSLHLASARLAPLPFFCGRPAVSANAARQAARAGSGSTNAHACRATDFESGGRGFESLRARQGFQSTYVRRAVLNQKLERCLERQTFSCVPFGPGSRRVAPGAAHSLRNWPPIPPASPPIRVTIPSVIRSARSSPLPLPGEPKCARSWIEAVMSGHATKVPVCP